MRTNRWKTSILLVVLFVGVGRLEGQIVPSWVTELPPGGSSEVLITNRWQGNESRVVVAVNADVHVYFPDGTLDPAWQSPYLIGFMRDVVLADVTGDGFVEVVVSGSPQIQGAGGDSIIVRDSTGANVPGWPVFNSSVNVQGGYIEIVAGDLDGRPGAEIVAVDLPPKVFAFSGDGQLMSGWPVSIPYPGGSFTEAWAGTAVGDLDLDGTPEIVGCPVFLRGITIPTPTYVFNPDGTLRQGWPFLLQGRVMSWPIMADLNGDYRCEIGAGSDNTVAVLQRQGQFYYWPFPLMPCSFSLWPMGAADLTGDGVADFVTTGGCLSILDTTIPSHVQALTLPLQFFFDPLIGDMNGDGNNEIVVAVHDNDPTNPITDPRLYVFDSSLQVLPGFPVHLELYSASQPNAGEIRRETMALGDLNGDGDLEIVIGFTTRLLMFDLPNQGNPSTDYAWTHWRGNAQRNGFLYEGRYPPAYYRRGDANRDAVVDVADVPAMLRRLFLDEPTKCRAQFDFNDTDTLDLADPMDLLMYLFAGGSMAPGAYPDCEVTQPLTEPLGCFEYECP